MSQKIYPKLRKENLHAAKEIVFHLRNKKALSEATVRDIFADARGIRFRHGSFDKLMETTKKFLKAHGVVTFHQINGLNLWIATQKCFRAKLENMFIEYQYVTNISIDQAIEWQEKNGGLVPAKIEGEIIAKNILGLTGNAAIGYASNYVALKSYVTQFNKMDRAAAGTPLRPDPIEMKYVILNPIRNSRAIRKH